MFVKDHLVFQNVLKSSKNVRYKMRLDGENESFNTEFVHSNILLKRMLISIHTYKVVSLIRKNLQDVFPLNKLNLLNFSRNVLNIHNVYNLDKNHTERTSSSQK